MTAAMAELVGRAQQGDTEAHGLIYRQYHGTVYWFILRRVRHTELAEDLTHDTFIRAIRAFNLPAGLPGGFTWQGKDLGAWLCTIARNLVFDHYKSGRYRIEVTTGDDVYESARPDPAPGPEAAAVDRHRDVALVNALAALTADQREAVINRYLRDMTLAETAAAMGRGEGAVKALTYRAVQSIGRQFDGSWR